MTRSAPGVSTAKTAFAVFAVLCAAAALAVLATASTIADRPGLGRTTVMDSREQGPLAR